MIKPSQIREMEFSKSTMGGYKTSEVNSFLAEVAISYEQLYKENSELLKKLRLLVDGIEEYRRREQNAELTSNPALADAKEEADKIISEARAEAGRIIADARAEAEKAVAEVNNQASELEGIKASAEELVQLREKEERALADIRAESEKFRRSLLAMYTEHLSLIQSMVDVKPKAAPPEKKDEVPLKKLDITEVEVEEEFTYDDIDEFFAEAVSDEQSRIKEAFGGFRFEMGTEADAEPKTEEPVIVAEPEKAEEDIIIENTDEDIETEANEVIIEFPSKEELSANDESEESLDDVKSSFKISFPEDEESADAEENLDDLFEGFFNSSSKSE